MSIPDEPVGRLRLAVKTKGLKQQALADMLGVNLDRVKSLLSGKVKKLDAAELQALQDKLYLRTDWLLRGIEPMFMTEAEQAVRDRLRHATHSVAHLQVPDWIKRLAHEWCYAIERADATRLIELANMSVGPRVAETPAAYTVPSVAKVDTALLQAVIQAGLHELDLQHKTLDAAKLSELLVLLYEASLADHTPNPDVVRRLIRLVN